ncbi:MAG: hypothetical protein HYY16_19415 [Planctomycetes bacterium]|nr:hypothetical protein [Planctomycetota bacterium]
MSRIGAAILVGVLTTCAWPQEAPKDLTLDEIVERSGALTEGINKLPWRCFTQWGDQGYETFGRWERGKGLRSTIYALSCVEDPVRSSMIFSKIGNKFLAIWTEDHVSLAHLTIMLESRWQTMTPPHLLFRARKGQPDHERIDPFQIPAEFPILLHVDEPLAYFQMDPKVMLGHEAGLTLIGREQFEGKECYVLRSERSSGDLQDRIPRAWYRALSSRKTFYVERDTFMFAGMKVESERYDPMDPESGVVLHEVLTSVVRTRQKPASRKHKIPGAVEAFMPELVDVRLHCPERPEQAMHYLRRVVVEECVS